MANSKLAAIDLNLLVVFDTVMQERSVTRTAGKLGLSQPAISHALARLRHMLKDELFVRSPKGMVPTPRAEQLAVPVRKALEGLQQSLEPTKFDPSKSTQTFRVAVDNYSAVVLVGLLAERMRKVAPGVSAEFHPSGTLDIPDLLDGGEIDLAIGIFEAQQHERFAYEHLLQDEFVALMRKTHPAIADGKLSKERLAALPHLALSSVNRYDEYVEQTLARQKVTLRIGLRAPLLSAERCLVNSDMITIVRERLAEAMMRNARLALVPLPFLSMGLQTGMIWHRRLDNEAAHRWLRELVGGVCQGLRGGRSEA